MLVQVGADVQQEDGSGFSAAHYAQQLGHSDVVAYLEVVAAHKVQNKER